MQRAQNSVEVYFSMKYAGIALINIELLQHTVAVQLESSHPVDSLATIMLTKVASKTLVYL